MSIEGFIERPLEGTIKTSIKRSIKGFMEKPIKMMACAAIEYLTLGLAI